MSTAEPTHGPFLQMMHDAIRDPGCSSVDQVTSALAKPSRISETEALAIYQRSYYQRLLKCMSEQFPALCHALGEQLFVDFARDYLHTHAPVSYTLYDLGRRFPDFLEDTRPDRDTQGSERELWIDFMVDLAKFERLVFTLFDAPGHEGRPLADVDTPDEHLHLQPAFALGAYRFPVAEYYHAVRADVNPALPPYAPCHVALVRKDFVTRTVLLGSMQYAFLQLLQHTGTIDGALSALCDRYGFERGDVERSWSGPDGVRNRWVSAGFFALRDAVDTVTPR